MSWSANVDVMPEVDVEMHTKMMLTVLESSLFLSYYVFYPHQVNVQLQELNQVLCYLFVLRRMSSDFF